MDVVKMLNVVKLQESLHNAFLFTFVGNFAGLRTVFTAFSHFPVYFACLC